MKRQDRKKLEHWQTRVAAAKSAWEEERSKMDRRELQYSGDRELRKIIDKDCVQETQHVWNITAENIESIVDSNIPKPKVTPRREKDQRLARIIEHMVTNELDRLRMEEINDLQERTCPIQGGTLFLVEWDNAETGADRKGEVQISAIHPKMLIPQPGVYSGIEDMDYICLMIPDTKANVKRTYGVDVKHEEETDPAVKSVDENARSEEDLVTRYVVYYRNGDGIGKFHYVGDTILEDLDDYQARRMRRCARCGALENTENLILDRPTTDGSFPEDGKPEGKAQKGVCAYCGSDKWEDSSEEYFDIMAPVEINGETVGGYEAKLDEYGNAVAVAKERVPYYNPKIYPVVLQRNVSVFGKLLGDSDVDKIEDQQNTVNRMEQKIAHRLLMSGTRASLPPDSKITVTPEEGKEWRLESIDHKNYLGTYDFSGDISQLMIYMNQVYQESRNILGITDSYQGRADTTATSGKAKEFSAQQSAGRMESKRVMKNAAYAKLFEMIFKLKLAYCDEPRPVYYRDQEGVEKYEEFNKLDFLERDANGEWRWNTDFLFSVDDTGGLAGNRGAMWREITAQLQAGAMGDPSSIDTLIDYWTIMEELHYPAAGKMRQRLAQRRKDMVQTQVNAASATVPGNGAPVGI